MSITLTDPSGAASQIINSAEYVAATNQAEDSTHKNVRVRAEIYVGGVKVAVTEQPKALTAFNFNELLRRYITPLRYRGNSYYSPPATSVLTGWTADPGGSFSTFTTSGKNITAAVTTTAGYAKSDVIAMAAGELYALVVHTQTQNSGDLYARLHDGTNAFDAILIPTGDVYNTNRVYWFMAPAAGNYTIQVGSTGVADWEGEYDVMKMTALDTYGRPLVHYWVNFTEYWEDGSDVTTAGTSSKSLVAGFIHSQPKYRTFSEFVLKTGSVGNFLTLAQSQSSATYVSRNKLLADEYQNIVFLSLSPLCQFQYTKASVETFESITAYAGWGVLAMIKYSPFPTNNNIVMSLVEPISRATATGSNLIAEWYNHGSGPFETLTTSGTEIISAINSSSIGIARSNTFAISAGEYVIMEFNITLNSGVMPYVFLSGAVGTIYPNAYIPTPGVNTVMAYCDTYSPAVYLQIFDNANICNISMSGVAVNRVTYNALTNTLYQPLVAACDKDRFVEFTNHLGGLDYVTFRGDYKRRAVTEKEFYKTAGRMRKPLTSYPLIRENLKTRFIDESMSLVADLIDATSVVLDDKEVTVLTDSVDTYSEGDLVINEIEIEYEE